MRYLSLFSGIEAASVAWKPMDWQCAAVSEIEPFPCAVLAHHYPEVPNLGDITKFKEWPHLGSIDLVVGGSPCQSFSVAGLRKGMDDPRGNLMLTYLAVINRVAPRWVVYENVPGLLSSNGGRDFGAFLGGLAELGYGFAYRVLDAQYFGLAQRRRRVFVVAYLGDWRRAAAVLFERESMLGDTPPSRETREDAASGLIGGIDYEGNGHDCGEPTGPLLKGSPTGGGHALPAIARALTTSNQRIDAETETETETLIVADSYAIQAGALRENPESGPDGVGVQANIAYTLEARAEVQAVADTLTSHCHNSNGASAGNNTGMINPIYQGAAVRRLTPRECERLQGFPDDYTAITMRKKPAADGPRYKSLGNSMAVPVMRWLGERIQLVDRVLNHDQTQQPQTSTTGLLPFQGIGELRHARMGTGKHED